MDQAKLESVNPATYRIYIAPLIFALAPMINTLLSASSGIPKPGDPWHFEAPSIAGWKLPVGHPARRGRDVPGADVEGGGGGDEGRAEARDAARGRRAGSVSDRRHAMTPEEAVRAAQHRPGPRLDDPHVPQARRRDPGRRGHARRAADALRQHPRRGAGVPARRPRRLPPAAQGEAAEAPPRRRVLRRSTSRSSRRTRTSRWPRHRSREWCGRWKRSSRRWTGTP